MLFVKNFFFPISRLEKHFPPIILNNSKRRVHFLCNLDLDVSQQIDELFHFLSDITISSEFKALFFDQRPLMQKTEFFPKLPYSSLNVQENYPNAYYCTKKLPN